MKVCVLGLGSWGSALANVLANNQHDVTIYGINQASVDEMNQKHQLTEFFGSEVHFNKSIKASTDLKVCLKGCEMLLIALPSHVIKEVLKQVEPLLDHKIYIVNASKGFDLETFDRLSTLIRKSIDSKHHYEIISLIGPSHAEEVVINQITTVAAVSLDLECARLIQKAFSNDYFRVYTQNDEIGSEYGVAMKNIFALASGALAGLGYGDNARASLITRGLQEMIAYGTFKGGKMETFLGLTGIGDLIVTATSQHSRNFRAGFEIGKANDGSVLQKLNMTVEGAKACKAVYEESQLNQIELPIISAIYQVLYLGKKPSEVIEMLMARDLKPEFL